LLYLEGRNLIEATLERRPPHYHVAVFPQQYRTYVARITKMSETELLAEMADNATYMVRRNDTLWRISKRFDTTPEQLQRVNGLKSSTIYPGQVLKVPAAASRDR
jgi:nucleoid-associated protein YgaU